MKNLLLHKERYYKNFANAVYDQFRKIRYGISSCSSSTNPLYLDEIRKELVDYQANDDGEALCQVAINSMSWLPVYYPSTDDSCDYQSPWSGGGGYKVKSCKCGPSSLGMSYVNQNTSTNVIEVNSGGCITRINVNPVININNNNNSNFIYTQNCSDPQTVWYIVHNLNIVPNVWAIDCSGQNISGTVAAVDNNTITLTFSSPVAGTAYLS